MKQVDSKKLLVAIVPLILALISIFVIARFATSTTFHKGTIQSLDDKKTTVMQLTAASTAASAAITLIPGDTATPIAEKLADLSTYFLLVICALYLEKYLLTVTGYAAFVVLIPIACILYSANVFLRRESFQYLAKKMIIFAVAIVLVVPASVKVSDLIEATYGSSIDDTISAAKETTGEIEDSAQTETDSSGLLSGIISNVKEEVSNITTKVQNVLNNFIEALAVLLVTSCVIPIVVLLFFIWLIKVMLGVNIPIPTMPGRPGHAMKKIEKIEKMD